MKLSDLLIDCKVEKIVGDGDPEISGLTIRGDEVRGGELFFCIDGTRYDSHALAREVSLMGAAAFICEKPIKTNKPQVIVRNVRATMSRIVSVFYGKPCEKLKLIGVTGTNGKTTCVHMIAAILKNMGKKVAVIGTLGAEFDGKIVKTGFTTPDPILLHSIMSDIVLANTEYVVMEVSAHALYYHKLDGLHFTACLFTNCTRDHLDFFGSMNRYMQAKSRLFQKDVTDFAVLNYDDELGRKLGETVPSISYALDNPAEVFAVEIEESLRGTSFVLNLSDELYDVSLHLLGRHNVSNAIGSAALCRHLGASMEEIGLGLASLKGVKGRLEYVASYHGADIFVDFAHTPDGLEKSLEALTPFVEGRLICLFGCGGNRDKDKRELMGEVAGGTADLVILTSDNPRYEDPFDIIMDIEKGVRRYTKDYVTVQDRQDATNYAIKHLQKGDILLIAGKGGEEFLEIRDQKIPYEDTKVVLSILRSLENSCP